MTGYEVDQPVKFRRGSGRSFSLTGKVLGAEHLGSVLHFIVLFDTPHKESGIKAACIPYYDVEPLRCHWCVDTQVVLATPVTQGQLEDGTAPTKPCPYCTDDKAQVKLDSGYEPGQTPMSVSPLWNADGNGFRA